MRALLVALLLLFPGLPALADDNITTTRDIIERQIDAFLKDDAATAYSFAAPGIQARYPDKDAFFAMVKKSYQPVYNPGNFAFGRNKSLDDGATILHEVIISAKDGKDWRAIYRMMRQSDGTYRIGGVVMTPEHASKGI